MGSTYGTLETQMLNFMGNPTDDTTTKAMLMASFNWFQHILSLRADWDELQTYSLKPLTSGTYMYHITSSWSLNDLRKIYSIKLFDGTRYFSPMDYVTPRKWDEMAAPTIHFGNAKPEFYTRRGNYIIFNRKADASLSVEIWYFKYPTAVASTASVIDFPTNLDSALCSMAIGMTYLGMEELQAAAKWMQIGSGMFKEQGFDMKTVVDMKAFSNIDHPITDYWSDPFQKENP